MAAEICYWLVADSPERPAEGNNDGVAVENTTMKRVLGLDSARVWTRMSAEADEMSRYKASRDPKYK